MSKRDYYEVLGIIKICDQKMKLEKHIEHFQKNIIQILIKKHDAEDKFKEVTEAYEVLSDETKKANYDQFGHADPNQGFGGFGGGGG